MFLLLFGCSLGNLAAAAMRIRQKYFNSLIYNLVPTYVLLSKPYKTGNIYVNKWRTGRMLSAAFLCGICSRWCPVSG